MTWGDTGSWGTAVLAVERKAANAQETADSALKLVVEITEVLNSTVDRIGMLEKRVTHNELFSPGGQIK